MADATIAHAIIRFKNAAPLETQDESLCLSLANEVYVALRSVRGDGPSPSVQEATTRRNRLHLDPLLQDRTRQADKFTALELQWLKAASLSLYECINFPAVPKGDIWIEKWFPQYAAALQMECVGVGLLALRLIALDGWERRLHFPRTGSCVHSAVATKHSIIHCGRLESDRRTQFLQDLDSELEEAQSRKGNQRSAANNETPGHQKTPPFLASLVRNALDKQSGQETKKHLAKGGMTDVGKHTGGAPRDTCWSLVASALEQSLPGNSHLFTRFKVVLLERLFEKFVSKSLTLTSTAWDLLDQAFQILDNIVLDAVSLKELGYRVSEIQARCEKNRQRLDRFAGAWVDNRGQSLTFSKIPAMNKMKQKSATIRALVDPKAGSILLDLDATSQIGWSAVIQNLTWEFVDARVEPVSKVSVCLAGFSSRSKLSTLRAIELVLIHEASKLQASSASPSTIPCNDLRKLVETYRQAMGFLATRVNYDEVVRVRRHSMYLLLSHISFCLTHQQTCKSYPTFAKYKICLDWRRLDVCVLDEAVSREALLSVVGYIKRFNSAATGAAIFDYDKQDDTKKYAREQAQNLRSLCDAFEHVQSMITTKVDSAWNDISTRKASVSTLRNKVKDHQQQKLIQHRSQVKMIKDNIRSLVRMPEFVVSPLPQQRDEALELLFFMAMPSDIECTADLCCRAQRALSSMAVNTTIRATAPGSASWAAHFIRFKATSTFQATTTVFTATPPNLNAPHHEYGPSLIDHVGSRERFHTTCAWYPTVNGTSVMWADHQGGYVNPSAITASSSREYFTPKAPALEGDSVKYQWAIAYPGGLARSNVAYAMADGSFEALKDYRGYLSLASIRAHPMQQLRKIFSALDANSMDLSNQAIAMVVRQALFQVGEISDASPPTLQWHADISNESAMTEFENSLSRLVEDIGESPRRWDSVPLLADIAGFVAEFGPEEENLRLRLAQIARGWAEQTRQEWMRGVPPKEQRELRARECLLYGYALLCFRGGAAVEEDMCLEIAELLLLFRSALLFAKESSLDKRIAHVEADIQDIMADRIVDVVPYVTARISTLPTKLGRLANATIPASVEWTTIVTEDDEPTSIIMGKDESAGIEYVINLFTGELFTNGAQPGGLPPMIRDHARYVQLFGYQDFEVISSRPGVFETLQPFHGCLYRFRVVGSELRVEENHVQQYPAPTAALRLCDAAWVSSNLATSFPARLASLYSHWFWEKHQCVLVRAKLARVKHVAFVIKLQTGQLSSCFQVPRDDQEQPIDVIIRRAELGSYRTLVAPEPRLELVLSKFEDKRFMHFLMAPKDQQSRIEIDLPRFGMRFTEHLGHFMSVEYGGYALDLQQQLPNQLWRFQRYLVLKNIANDCTAPAKKVIVPVGDVIEKADGGVDVAMTNEPAATVSVNVFETHERLGVLTAETIEARLQLAALYAASANLVPWTQLKMTGGEAAIQVLRGCWSGRPLSRQAQSYLLTVRNVGSRHTPTLALLTSILLENSRRLDFLFTATDAADRVQVDVCDELDEYCAMSAGTVPYSSRVMLKPSEESQVFSSMSIRHVGSIVNATATVTLAPVPVASNFVQTQELYFKTLVRVTPACAETPAFPLTDRDWSESRGELTQELELSWSTHKRMPHEKLMGALFDLRFMASVKQALVREKLTTLWNYLQDAVNLARASKKEELLATVNRAPTLTVADLLRVIVDDSVLLHFVPQLTQESRNRFKLAARTYLETTVLDDKLKRMLSRMSMKPCPPVEYFIEELKSTRQWSTEKYPYWLAFEVEGGLQIRPEQYIIAKHLIDNPGSISQLNMGRGKTRVILPMLFLYYRYNASGRVVRSHFLSPLLSETRQFMHRVLSSGTLQLPFIELPFNRSVELNLRRVRLMQEAIEELKVRGGFLMIAPEHRLSLELKRVEIANSEDYDGSNGAGRAICSALDLVMAPSQFIDIFDESDAVLHHKYHLVYAVGLPVALDGGSDRWIAAEALLRVLMNPNSKRVAALLTAQSKRFCIQSEYADRLGAFNGFRLNGATHRDDDEVRDSISNYFNEALIEDLIDNPPFELSWIKPLSQAHPCLKGVIIDRNTAALSELADLPTGVQDVKKYLLALRGLLAYGVLESCLEKRNRVTYGLPDPGTRPKAVAIPFTAADLPSERSEFSHPDVSIVLTLLAYYHAGLSDKEIRRSFEMLFRLDYSEQLQYYAEWYQSIAPALDARHQDMLSKLDHISLDNAPQFAIVCDSYRYSTEVINFFLNRQVFPRDTKQYPNHLSRSAWDLVRGPSNVGFSGTNDTQRLLPYAVTQREPEEPTLRGTNGKMIDLLVTTTCGYETLSDKPSKAKPLPLWRLLMAMAMEKGCGALIDTGALLAGIAIEEAARFLIQQPGFTPSGVTYYDTRSEFDGWVVLERERQLVRPLKMSSLHERDTFVIFDEARSRGSDMKLRPDCVALLTLGPSITKDKLMQGAGRMRQLGQHQKLWITSTAEVQNSVMDSYRRGKTYAFLKRGPIHKLTIVDILKWVVDNTEQQCTHGLLEWAKNGTQFCAKEVDEKKELHVDDWELDKQYGQSLDREPIYDLVVEHCERVHDLVDIRKDDDDDASTETDSVTMMLDQIDARALQYGEDEYVLVSSFGEECERELQAEEEEEEEQEELGHATVAVAEKAWHPLWLFGKTSALQLKIPEVDIISLAAGIKSLAYPESIGSQVTWDATKLYTTSNFWKTIAPSNFKTSDARASMKWTAYLRMIDVLVVFRDATVLALTDQEADALFACIPTNTAKLWGFVVMHLHYAARAVAQRGSFATVADVPLHVKSSNDLMSPFVPVAAIFGGLLFNGDTLLISDAQRALAERMLRSELLSTLRAREETLRAYVEARRFPQRWTRSFLHDLATRMDLEGYTKPTPAVTPQPRLPQRRYVRARGRFM